MQMLRFLSDNNSTELSNTLMPSYDHNIAVNPGVVVFGWFPAFFWIGGASLALEVFSLTFGYQIEKSSSPRGEKIDHCASVGSVLGWVYGNAGSVLGWGAGNALAAYGIKCVADPIIANTHPDDLSIQRTLIALCAMPALGVAACAGSLIGYGLYKTSRDTFNAARKCSTNKSTATPTLTLT